MKTVGFKEANMKNSKNLEEFLIFEDGTKKVIIKKLKADFKERLKILRTGELWMVIGSDSTSAVTTECPFEVER